MVSRSRNQGRRRIACRPARTVGARSLPSFQPILSSSSRLWASKHHSARGSRRSAYARVHVLQQSLRRDLGKQPFPGDASFLQRMRADGAYAARPPGLDPPMRSTLREHGEVKLRVGQFQTSRVFQLIRVRTASAACRSVSPSASCMKVTGARRHGASAGWPCLGNRSQKCSSFLHLHPHMALRQDCPCEADSLFWKSRDRVRMHGHGFPPGVVDTVVRVQYLIVFLSSDAKTRLVLNGGLTSFATSGRCMRLSGHAGSDILVGVLVDHHAGSPPCSCRFRASLFAPAPGAFHFWSLSDASDIWLLFELLRCAKFRQRVRCLEYDASCDICCSDGQTEEQYALEMLLAEGILQR